MSGNTSVFIIPKKHTNASSPDCYLRRTVSALTAMKAVVSNDAHSMNTAVSPGMQSTKYSRHPSNISREKMPDQQPSTPSLQQLTEHARCGDQVRVSWGEKIMVELALSLLIMLVIARAPRAGLQRLWYPFMGGVGRPVRPNHAQETQPSRRKRELPLNECQSCHGGEVDLKSSEAAFAMFLPRMSLNRARSTGAARWDKCW